MSLGVHVELPAVGREQKKKPKSMCRNCSEHSDMRRIIKPLLSRAYFGMTVV